MGTARPGGHELSPCVSGSLSIGKRGRTGGGSDINKLGLGTVLSANQGPAKWGICGWEDTEYGIQAGLSLDLHRAASPRSLTHLVGSVWISAEFVFTPRKAGIVNFSLPTPPTARPRPFVPASSKLCEASPLGGVSQEKKPSPSQRKKRRGSSANFHAKDPRHKGKTN